MVVYGVLYLLLITVLNTVTSRIIRTLENSEENDLKTEQSYYSLLSKILANNIKYNVTTDLNFDENGKIIVSGDKKENSKTNAKLQTLNELFREFLEKQKMYIQNHIKDKNTVRLSFIRNPEVLEEFKLRLRPVETDVSAERDYTEDEDNENNIKAIIGNIRNAEKYFRFHGNS